MTVHRGTATTMAEFTALWSDPSVTLAEIGARLGISKSAVGQRARTRGLPPRPAIRRGRKFDPQILRDLYLAGVSTTEIAAQFGMTAARVGRAARSMGLTRPRATRHHPVTVDDCRTLKLRQAMERDARATRAAMCALGMATGGRHG